MNVHISMSAENENIVLEKGMEYINQITKDKPRWKKHKTYGSYEADCEILNEDIEAILRELIKKYPTLELSASYSYEIREEDRSAQWWKTVIMKTEHLPNGMTTLRVDSTTNWF